MTRLSKAFISGCAMRGNCNVKNKARMENLRALVNGHNLNAYQKALAKHEFDGMCALLDDIENAMERWHHGRDNDDDTLTAIDEMLANNGRLKWFHRKD